MTRTVHICCGYPNHLNDEDYKKADATSYHRLAGVMDELDFDAFAVARSRIEPVEEVIQRLRDALGHIDRDRLIVAPDCGLGLLTRDLAKAKLEVMCAAAVAV